MTRHIKRRSDAVTVLRHSLLSSQEVGDWETDGGPAKQSEESVVLKQEIDTLKLSVLTALNQQILYEQNNAHVYQSVSLYFGRLNLYGLEAFMIRQMEQERKHANKLIRYVADRNGRVKLGKINAPQADFASPLEAARSVLDLVLGTTRMVDHLYEIACNEGDFDLQVLMHWYLLEQDEGTRELTALMEYFDDQLGQLVVPDRQ